MAVRFFLGGLEQSFFLPPALTGVVPGGVGCIVCCPGCLTRGNHKKHLADGRHEQWKNSGYLGYIGDENPTQLYGDYFITHEIRIPIKQPGFNGKYPDCFFSLLNWYQIELYIWLKGDAALQQSNIAMQIPLFQEEIYKWWNIFLGGAVVREFPYYMRSWSLLQHVQPISGTETGYELWEICVKNGWPHGIFWEFRYFFGGKMDLKRTP